VRYKRILVTGGAGFIGSHLVDRLLADGREVSCIDDFNDYYPPVLKRFNVSNHVPNGAYELFENDIRDAASISEIVRRWRPEAIVHLAARAGVRPSVVDPFLYEQTNVSGTLNVLEAARISGTARVVFGSSSSVYGFNTKVPFEETDAVYQQISPYAATKLAGEALCSCYAYLYSLPIVSLRFFTVYGPRQRPDLAIRKFIQNVLHGRPIVLYGDGSSSRDYTYVDDIVSGIMAAIDIESSGHEIVNLGNSVPVSLLDMVATIEHVVGRRAEIEWAPLQAGDVPRTFASVTKARGLLRYDPKTSLEEGIRELSRWIESLVPELRTLV